MLYLFRIVKSLTVAVGNNLYGEHLKRALQTVPRAELAGCMFLSFSLSLFKLFKKKQLIHFLLLLLLLLIFLICLLYSDLFFNM